VARDVRLGYVGRDSARRDYQVAIERDGQIDALETQQLRHQVAE
jgi:hypothetical protein